MILKSFEIDKKDISKIKFFLIYGENEGLKREIINKIISHNEGKKINFEESQILKNKHDFFNEITNKSLFEKERIFLLERCTDKISEIVLDIYENNNDELFSIVKNYKLDEVLKNNLSKNKYFRMIKLKKNLPSFENYNLIVNTDYFSPLTKKYFNKKITKKYNSFAYTTIIQHEKIKNNKYIFIQQNF